MTEQTVGIVGGGILGLAIGRELSRRRPGVRVTVFEKEDRLGAHQTGHNSGVVHAGIYYPPGSLKAQLCTRGRQLLRGYCSEHGLPYDECGKLVVAIDEAELTKLDALERTAGENNVPGLRRVGAGEIKDIEPHVTGLAALHSPATAITDFVKVAGTMGGEIEKAGGQVLPSTLVTGIRRTGGRVEVTTGDQRHVFDRVVICAGLQADRVAGLVGGSRSPRIIPFRGEYMTVREPKADYVRGLVYPVPDPRYPFLGVHFTRLVSGGLEVGPNAVLALRREGYRRSSARLADIGSIASWPGSWHLAKAHWRTGVREIRGSLSRRAYMQTAQRYVPDIGPEDVIRGRAGVRAQAVDRDGSLVDDFRIDHADQVTAIRNAPSPAATSSLAIAAYVVDQIISQG